MTSGAYHLNLYSPRTISIRYSEVFRHFEIWRLITNFFFIAPFSLTFGIRLLIILRNGVSLERGPFDKRTADYLWMYIFGAFSLLVMAAIPFLWTPFLGPSLVFMIVYVWGREFPNERVNIHGLFQLKGFYLPWYMLAVDLILGNPLKPDMLGIVAGHLFYFLTVLYPLSGGKNYCKTPIWVHKLVAFWGEGFQANSPVRKDASEGVAFSGRSFRLNGSRATRSRQDQPDTPVQANAAPGGAFSGKSRRLNGR
ncbi:hypothetical protein LguiB_029256 [Lonicera macranthoides]